MALFEEHLKQAKSNLSFLERVNNNLDNYFDWLVTISFYSAVHLINAHVVKSTGHHYRTHEDIDNIISPYNISPGKLPESEYLSYKKLQALARRSRYLISDDYKKKEERAFFTYEKHFSKAIYHLDLVLQYINKQYKINFENFKLRSVDLKGRKLKFFDIT
jgi:hypothetical protein